MFQLSVFYCKESCLKGPGTTVHDRKSHGLVYPNPGSCGSIKYI